MTVVEGEIREDVERKETVKQQQLCLFCRAET